MDMVVLGCRAQNLRVLRKIALSQRRHDAATAGTGDAQANLIPDGERLADPGILDEGSLAGRGRDHDVGPKSLHLETPLRIQLAKAVERRRGQQMNHGTVEEGSLRQREVRDRVSVVEAFHVGPILFGIGRPWIAR